MSSRNRFLLPCWRGCNYRGISDSSETGIPPGLTYFEISARDLNIQRYKIVGAQAENRSRRYDNEELAEEDETNMGVRVG